MGEEGELGRLHHRLQEAEVRAKALGLNISF